MKPQIPWLRVFVEGVVIVASILLALALDEWREERGELEDEQQALSGLQTDFRRYREIMESRVSAVTREIEQIEFLFSLGAGRAEELPVARADSAFRWLIVAGTVDPGEGTLDALIGAGRLSLIRRDELRDLLTAWKTRLDEVLDGESVIREFVKESLVPGLAEAGVPLMRAYRSVFPDRPVSLVSDEATAAIYARVLSDPELRSLMSYRHNWADDSLGEYERTIQMIDQILALISEELES